MVRLRTPCIPLSGQDAGSFGDHLRS
jgi:hypothetical protein